jgi:hypothetical protein
MIYLLCSSDLDLHVCCKSLLVVGVRGVMVGSLICYNYFCWDISLRHGLCEIYLLACCTLKHMKHAV